MIIQAEELARTVADMVLRELRPLLGRTEDQGPSENLLSLTDVCRVLGVCRKTLWKLRKAGGFPEPLVVGGAGRYLRSDVMAYLAQQRSPARPGPPGSAVPPRRATRRPRRPRLTGRSQG